MKKKFIYLIAAVTLVAAVCGGKPTKSEAADPPIDLTKDGYITVYPVSNTSAFNDDIKNAKVVVDIYRVADVSKTFGYDTYSYEFMKDYASLSISEQPSASEWQSLAQAAAKIALNKESSKTPVGEVSGKPAETRLDMNQQGEGHPASGLYLLIARGENLKTVSDYTVEIGETAETDETDETAETGGWTKDIATIAYSDQYQYFFQPQLISLPVRGNGSITDVVVGEDGQPHPAEYGTSANKGPWTYDLKVYLKPEREQRFGGLEIVKDLLSHESENDKKDGKIDKEVTFVFSIEGKIGDKVVYSNVESITFTKAGQESVTVDRIPAGAVVTVKEVYSGSSYQIDKEENREQEVTIKAADVVPVKFVNEYNGHQGNGHGIKNQFTYSIQDDRWNWEKDPVQSTEGGNQ